MPDVVYSFTVRGCFANGNTTKMTGRIKAADGYPSAAFDLAVKTCQELSPGLQVDLNKPGQVSLRKLKTTHLQ